MKFKTLEEEFPELNKEVIIRYKESWRRDKGYYIVCLRKRNDEYFFEEAGGEQYTTWELDEVLGWMYVSELDKI